MATYNTTVYEKQIGRLGKPAVKVDGLFGTGNLRYAVCEYKTRGDEVAGDTVNLVKLPKNSLPMPALSHIVHRHSAEIKVSIGVASDPLLYGEKIRLRGQNTNVSIGSGSPPDYVGLGSQFTTPKVLGEGDEVVSLKFDTAVGAARDITIYLAYIAE